MIGRIVVMGRNNKTGWKNLALRAEELFVCTGSLILARAAGQMGKIPSLAVVTSGALFYLVKQDSLSLYLGTGGLFYLVKAGCSTQAGFPHSVCGGIRCLLFLSSLLLACPAQRA